jgi:carbamoyl-phosphate synthase large subunit
MPEGNALLSSSGSKGSLLRHLQLAVRKLSPESVVFAGDSDPNALTRFLSDYFWVMPDLDTTGLEVIANELIARNITTVLPSRDGELVFWARNASYFLGKGINVISSPLPVIELCRDKLMFASYGTNHGLPFIPTSTDLSEISGDRVVVKERFGSGSSGMWLDQTRASAQLVSTHAIEPIFQPQISGIEISIDVWGSRNNGVYHAAVRERVLVVRGESKVTRVFRDEKLERFFGKLAKDLGIVGPAVFQAFLKDESVHVIECNPRFGGASTASIAAGIPLLELSLLDAWGSNFEPDSGSFSLRPLTQVRWSKDEVFYDSDF